MFAGVKRQIGRVGVENSGGLRILVVEDELLVALGMQEMLGEIGFDTLGPLPRLEDALRAAQTEAVDGAILDVNLRGHTVYPVAEALRARGIPFLFSTGYGSGSVALDSFREVEVLEKPYEPSSFREAVLRAFGPASGAPRQSL